MLSIDKQSTILKLTLITTIIKIALDFYLINKYQLIGATLVFSISNIFIAFTALVISVKHLEIKLLYFHLIKILFAALIALSVTYIVPESQFILVNLLSASLIFFITFFNSNLALEVLRE